MNNSGSPNVDLQMNPNAAKPVAMRGKPNRVIRAVAAEAVVSLLVPGVVAVVVLPPDPVKCTLRPARRADNRRKFLSNPLEIVRYIAAIVSKRRRADAEASVFSERYIFWALGCRVTSLLYGLY
jgi:hypothetical protein